MSCRRLAADYVAKHLHGLSVHGAMPADVAKVIATHNGSFHCDEAMACGFLRHTEQYQGAAVVRTRDPALIDQCTIVVDVGAVYDAEKLRFDHHQSSFHGTMTTGKKSYHTRLSSAGLVYKHFGREIIQNFVRFALSSPMRADILTMTSWPADITALSSEDLEVLYDKLYAAFVEEVDGVDNGVEAFALGPAAGAESPTGVLVKSYQQSTSLSSRVGKLQAWWNEEVKGEAATAQENGAFAEAVELTSTEFFEAVSYYAFSWMPARSLVERAFLAAADFHPSGQIVCLKERFCPWKDHLLDLEVERGCPGKVLYVLYSDGKGWRVQAVPKEIAGFESRKPLPFRGLRDQDLSTASGIEGGVFVHVSGFIGGMKTFEGAKQLAEKALTVA